MKKANNYWEKLDQIRRYTFWFCVKRGKFIFQVTTGDKPKNSAGYYCIGDLCKAKGFSDVVAEQLLEKAKNII